MTNTITSLEGIIDIIHEISGVVDVKIMLNTNEIIRTYNVLYLGGCRVGNEIIIEYYPDIELVRDKKNPELVLAWNGLLSSLLSIAT
jgi:hypothetical protein